MRILDMDGYLLCESEQNEHGQGKARRRELCEGPRNGDGVMRMLMLIKDRPGGIRDDKERNTA